MSSADRGHWGSPLEFIFSCLSYAVGLGNVWRFPYICYKNGGGAFLVQHTIMIFVAALPVVLIEMVIGQYSSLGPCQAFAKMAPLFKGLGYASLSVNILLTAYFHVIIAWVILYMYESFKSELPWGSCVHHFNTENCFSQLEDLKCMAGERVDLHGRNGTSEGSISLDDDEWWVMEGEEQPLMTFWNQSCHSVSSLCESKGLFALSNNRTHCFNSTSSNPYATSLHHLLGRVLSSEEFYSRYVLGSGFGASWEHWGRLQWHVVICLFAAWSMAAICLIRGIASVGKVMYFMTIFPFLILFALLVRGITLEGAAVGVLYFISPKWEMLSDLNVWGDAASQVFYALGLGCGSLGALSSYNNFHNNCHRDAIIVTIVNCFTSVLGGFSVFAVLGFLAHHMSVSVPDVVESGPGLAFVAYPEALLHMPQPQLWAVLFFFMFCCLALGTQVTALEAITTAIMDEWPKLREHKAAVGIITCACGFVVDIPMCFEGGVYLFTLLDWYVSIMSMVCVGLVETIFVGWVYGPNRFMGDVAEMGIKIPCAVKLFWKICFVAVTPFLLLVVIVFNVYELTPASYGSYVFPQWVNQVGILSGTISLVFVPAMALHSIWKLREYLKALFKPTEDWGPEHLDQKIVSYPQIEGAEEKGRGCINEFDIKVP
ncbi:sodium- and chloride-dependent GABA transporter 1-like [Ischnura elegans]|uniref:sodium- and chloride-dependent GABA transporter 1-like n=1 Tax=Ischnura elegans TaxID=197161 RepID=UPI001ED8A5A6|nr:sodium- and chloride-dependent GABA transporter 1-like [Ischnura elegans]